MLDVNSERSIYVQIAQMIENEILAGHLQEEDQAPSTNEFARLYGINPATARKGLNILVDEGILYKKRGLGMFVSEAARSIVLKKRQESFINERIPDLIKEAKRLEISLEELIKKIGDEINA